MADGPLIVQSDKTLLLEADHPRAHECRVAIAPFAELEKSPEHIHTYRVSALALWNARAAGHDAEQLVEALVSFSRYPVPPALLLDFTEIMDRYGRLMIEDDPAHGLVLRSREPAIFEEIARAQAIVKLLGTNRIDDLTLAVPPGNRGRLKQALLKVGWPADDRAGYVDGTAHDIALLDGPESFGLRSYQDEAVDSFIAGGSGVVVLPCGAGKTLVGLAAMARLGVRTLICVTSTVAARQWRRELLDKTSLGSEDVAEYSGEAKGTAPVTIATYQVLIHKKDGRYAHLSLFDEMDWGLIVYDEVHLLPAPVFRMTAEIQSRRRLGLTATLLREDGKEGDVFSLIGPKRYDAPWRDIESGGWIAPAACVEVRVSLTEAERMAYAIAKPEDRYRVAATAHSKLSVVETLLAQHADEPTLVIGQFIDQIEVIAKSLDAPLVTGRTPNRERERLYAGFRAGEITRLVVSKVANFSIDLPEATVAVQVSGTFGSRQEEAQRLGRILRPKADGRSATFYTVVSRDTNDQDFARRRQRFLAEQGYAYDIRDAADLAS